MDAHGAQFYGLRPGDPLEKLTRELPGCALATEALHSCIPICTPVFFAIRDARASASVASASEREWKVAPGEWKVAPGDSRVFS